VLHEETDSLADPAGRPPQLRIAVPLNAAWCSRKSSWRKSASRCCRILLLRRSLNIDHRPGAQESKAMNESVPSGELLRAIPVELLWVEHYENNERRAVGGSSDKIGTPTA